MLFQWCDCISGFDSGFENELNMKVSDIHDVFNYTMYIIN